MECKKQLIVKQQNQDKSFSQEITSLAEKKAIVKDRNTKARQLAQAYENQLKVETYQQSLEGN